VQPPTNTVDYIVNSISTIATMVQNRALIEEMCMELYRCIFLGSENIADDLLAYVPQSWDGVSACFNFEGSHFWCHSI